MKRTWIVALLTAALVMILCGQSFAAPQRMPGQARRMIVAFKNWVSEPAYDEILQRTGA